MLSAETLPLSPRTRTYSMICIFARAASAAVTFTERRRWSQRGVLYRRTIIHVLRTRRVARHDDRRQNDRARCGNLSASESPISRLADATYTCARVHVITAKVNAYLHDMCTVSTCVESLAPSLEINNESAKGKIDKKIRLTFIERVS